VINHNSVACPAGYYNTWSGQSFCYACEEGQYQNRTGSTGCRWCSAGSYSPSYALTSCLECTTGMCITFPRFPFLHSIHPIRASLLPASAPLVVMCALFDRSVVAIKYNNSHLFRCHLLSIKCNNKWYMYRRF
jgi:hypothetical protein